MMNRNQNRKPYHHLTLVEQRTNPVLPKVQSNRQSQLLPKQKKKAEMVRNKLEYNKLHIKIINIICGKLKILFYLQNPEYYG